MVSSPSLWLHIDTYATTGGIGWGRRFLLLNAVSLLLRVLPHNLMHQRKVQILVEFIANGRKQKKRSAPYRETQEWIRENELPKKSGHTGDQRIGRREAERIIGS